MNNLSQNSEKIEPQKIRYRSIDVFKGFSIALMVFVNSVQLFENIPSWSKHAADSELTLTYLDLVAPFFIFMMALNFKLSYKRRMEADGRRKVYLRFVRRYLIFIGIGLVLSLNIDSTGISLRWGTLQVLGLSGLLLLPFIELKTSVRLSIALIMMIFHQYLLSTDIADIIFNSIEGGIFGALSWGSMIILSSCLADGFKAQKEKQSFLVGGLICSILGFITNLVWEFSRKLGSISYVLVSVGISALIFYAFYYIFDIWGKNRTFSQKENILSIMGKNAFMLFIIHMVSISFIYSIFPLDTPIIIVVPVALLNVVLIWVIGYLMYKVDMIIIV